MDRRTVFEYWNAAWKDGLWAAPWSKTVADLTPTEAVRHPAPSRHSIWQIVRHMLFWREDALRRLTGSPPPTAEEIARGNFSEPPSPTLEAWTADQERLVASQAQIAAALAVDDTDIGRLSYVLPHDAYHMGQIMLLRALLGKPPIE